MSACHYNAITDLVRAETINGLCHQFIASIEATSACKNISLLLQYGDGDESYMECYGNPISSPGEKLKTSLSALEDKGSNRLFIDQSLVSRLELGPGLQACLIIPMPEVVQEDAISVLNEVFESQYKLLKYNVTDNLTGLYNRSELERTLNHIAATLTHNEKRRVKSEYYIAMLDIDFFKRVNDSYGHLYGDEVLLHFSQNMKKSFRLDDKLFRYGGEEFSAILSVGDENLIYQVLERFRKTIEEYTFPQVGQVTVSIGYAKIESNQLMTAQIDHADQALYYSKQNGRNRTSYYSELIAAGLIEKSKLKEDVQIF